MRVRATAQVGLRWALGMATPGGWGSSSGVVLPKPPPCECLGLTAPLPMVAGLDVASAPLGAAPLVEP